MLSFGTGLINGIGRGLSKKANFIDAKILAAFTTTVIARGLSKCRNLFDIEMDITQTLHPLIHELELFNNWFN